MNGPIVVDVGNTRIKWGRCDAGQVHEIAGLGPDDEAHWHAQWTRWDLGPDQSWIVSGVHPGRRDAMAAWLQARGAVVQVLTSFRQLPLEIAVEAPDKVGIDRLLNAVAANQRRPPRSAAILIDAGSAVTVDYLDATGVFRGGAIFPGLRLMAQALHDYTALLPIVSIEEAVAPPGRSTTGAIQTGVYHAVAGGVDRLIAEYRRLCDAPPEIYFTGGDATLLLPKMHSPAHHWPTMTLQGILLSVSR